MLCFVHCLSWTCVVCRGKLNKDKNNTLKKNIEYAPSVALFYKGDLVKYLDATNEMHIPYYETTSGFTSWIETYIDIKNTSN